MLKDPTSNAFSLLSDDAPLKKEPKKKEAEPKKTTPNNARNVDNDSKQSNRVAPAPKKNNGVPQRRNDPREDETIQVPKRTEKRDGRTRYRNVNFNKKGGRTFDRHSGTGRPPTENKKGGAGRRNWGKLNDDVEIAQDAEKNETKDEVEQTEESPSEEVEQVKEPEPEYTTLLQFSERREEQQRILEQKYGTTQVRKVDDSWSKGLKVTRPEEKQTTTTTSSPKETTRKQQGNKKVVNANEIFRIITEDKKGRGQRGKNRGGNRKGRDDRQRKSNINLNFTDKSSFPSLTGN